MAGSMLVFLEVSASWQVISDCVDSGGSCSGPVPQKSSTVKLSGTRSKLCSFGTTAQQSPSLVFCMFRSLWYFCSTAE